MFAHYHVFVVRFERMLNEMLSHLERQPRDKERRVAWLKYIEPLLSAVGLVLLAHFRRIFPLILKWMHADDDETVLLVRIISFLLTLTDSSECFLEDGFGNPFFPKHNYEVLPPLLGNILTIFNVYIYCINYGDRNSQVYVSFSVLL